MKEFIQAYFFTFLILSCGSSSLGAFLLKSSLVFASLIEPFPACALGAVCLFLFGSIE
ncbi:hypothetical protein CHU_1747 [Cytophaga hutchinsonii ATCC 33406]|uniref:Uncharacterized protein n=1 Tax=Cytophaga hutchinsonii (strain ATCC 33406 / DSM 1761 / CIP 103989 / NBRC 15051 / NCIMB 9469 / D465) TaxID=269798 RepID=A0A6N4SRJ6_CYTH3|nr:hypothetical protein CHU_1747 [Cytophaga hutchinsonii ATCC 33406]